MNLSTMYNTFNNRLRGRPSLLFHNRLILQRYGAWATSDVTLNTGSYTGTYLSNVRHNTEVNYDHGWDWDYKRNTKMFLLVSAKFWKRYIFKASKIFGACLLVSYQYSYFLSSTNLAFLLPYKTHFLATECKYLCGRNGWEWRIGNIYRLPNHGGSKITR